MQLMCESSEENNTKGLGIIPAKVKKFSGTEKIPHMGWNTIENPSGVLMNNVEAGEYLYFVHSYYVEENLYTTSASTYGAHFCVTLQKDNFYAIQPHPEKSAATGLKILSNFLAI
jgi:glutamine amidotransferase